jgi:hypothetical protein
MAAPAASDAAIQANLPAAKLEVLFIGTVPYLQSAIKDLVAAFQHCALVRP